jgi:hypothetical protein
LYNVTVLADTVRKKIFEGKGTIEKQGPKGKISDAACTTIKCAFLSYLAIAQMNGEAEEKITQDILPLLDELFHGTSKPLTDTRSLFWRSQRDCTEELNVSKEVVGELHRQVWTTYDNLEQWFDSWENTLVTLGFAFKDADKGDILISEEQKRRIVNMDKTTLSLNGSDGTVGGQPSLTVSVHGINRLEQPKTNPHSLQLSRVDRLQH